MTTTNPLHEARVLSMVITPINQPIFHEAATTVSIEDDAAGEYIVLQQAGDTWEGKLAFDRDEWELVKQTVDQLFSQCRNYP